MCSGLVTLRLVLELVLAQETQDTRPQLPKGEMNSIIKINNIITPGQLRPPKWLIIAEILC